VYFSYYAWKNAFASVCAAIFMMAVMQHPDIISDFKSIGGIPGLNLWNVLMANCVLGWMRERRMYGLRWDAPRAVQSLLIAYIAILLISSFRLLANLPRGFYAVDVISENIINTVKWVVPAILLFDSARTRKRIIIGSGMIIIVYFLLALQVIKHVPLRYAVTDEFQLIAAKMVQNSTGYNRVTLSMMLSGASWAALAMLPLARNRKQKWVVLAVAGAITLGQALTGGRSGYLSWGAVGLILTVAKWRKFLPVIPGVVIAVCIFLPGVRDRMLQGIAGDDKGNTYEATSGRNIAWPYVIEKIRQNPIFGFGCEAMTTTGLFTRILFDTEGGESFPHPHNAYLEILLNCGLIGFFVVVPFYLIVVKRAFSLFLDRGDPLFEVIGGMCCALVAALLVGSMGGQTFYPREGSVGMWAAIGLLIRLSVQREYALSNGTPLMDDDLEEEPAIDIDEEPSAQRLKPVFGNR
jgi:O-antigen ligase